MDFKIKRFVSTKAILIYLIVIIAVFIIIKFIGDNPFRFNFFSIFINVISFFGFLITINQLLTWKEIEEEKNKHINNELKKYLKTTIFQDFLLRAHILEEAQKQAIEQNWNSCLNSLRQVLKLIDELEVLNEKYILELDVNQIKDFRINTNLSCSHIENNINNDISKIKIKTISTNLREISSVTNNVIINLKVHLQ